MILTGMWEKGDERLMNVIISACLLGVCCRYNGAGTLLAEAAELMKKYHLIPVCPEIYGGLPTPRDPAERIGNRVITNKGNDVTAAYFKGAQEVTALALKFDCRYAILKKNSPSCGCGEVYDGQFHKKLIKGNGVLADCLLPHGIRIFNEQQIGEMNCE